MVGYRRFMLVNITVGIFYSLISIIARILREGYLLLASVILLT